MIIEISFSIPISLAPIILYTNCSIFYSTIPTTISSLSLLSFLFSFLFSIASYSFSFSFLFFVLFFPSIFYLFIFPFSSSFSLFDFLSFPHLLVYFLIGLSSLRHLPLPRRASSSACLSSSPRLLLGLLKLRIPIPMAGSRAPIPMPLA